MTEREKEREKLIELMGQVTVQCFVNKHCDKCAGYGKGMFCKNYLIADHLLSNGVIVPPCKVGQPVWFIPPTSSKPKIAETEIDKVIWKRGGLYIKLAFNAMYETSCKSIGKTVFLTKEEALKALKERKEQK